MSWPADGGARFVVRGSDHHWLVLDRADCHRLVREFRDRFQADRYAFDLEVRHTGRLPSPTTNIIGRLTGHNA